MMENENNEKNVSQGMKLFRGLREVVSVHWKNVPVVTFVQNYITLLLGRFATLSK